MTTNADGTTRVLEYGGCGCAGGEVTTAQDEHGRRKRYTKDALGRLAKTEELNWGGTVYSTTNYAYNARDQIAQITQQGQPRTFLYDGHGRLWKQTTPEQGESTFTYYTDDTVHVVADARGATATYSYTARHQVSGVDYNKPQGSAVEETADVGYLYDAAGNRFWMTDGEGYTFSHYDGLGRLDWEERNFTNVGTYRLGYEYNPGGELKRITYPWQFGSVEVTYGYDKAGRLGSVGGSGYGGVSTYASSINYRAFGAVKGMNYGDTRSLSTGYDRRLRPMKWDVAGVLGYKYYYDDFDEHTGRVTFAQHITGQNPALDRSQTSSSLDRSYEYDHVGRLGISHAGAEARAHAWTGQWGTTDGHYSQGYDYDVWRNVTHRYGWGGEVQGGSPSSSTDLYYTYATGGNGVINNRRGAPFVYDAAGNLTSDGVQTYAYDAQGNQVKVNSTSIEQGYDATGRRVRRAATGLSPSRYLRSSVLGGQVVIEMNQVGGSWVLGRGYVYTGAGLLAVQQDNSISFVHEDPVTKAKRVTSTAGAVQSELELDPYGAEAGGLNTAFQPRKFTTYERDPNGTDEAMFRRYNRRHARFDQPDPHGGSYDVADPQSFNRYSYTNNDPVNFADPTGLLRCNPIDSPRGCGEGWDVMTWGQTMRDFARREHWGGYSPQEREVPLPGNLRDRVEQRVNNPNSDCDEFIKQLLEEAGKISGKPYSTDAMTNYDRVQREGGFSLKEQGEKGTANFTGGGKRVVHIKPVSAPNDPRRIDNVQTNYAGTALNEVLHHARDGGVYNDRILARATYAAMTREQQKANPLPKTGEQKANSRYWHPLLLGHCPAPE